MPGLKLNHVSERSPRCFCWNTLVLTFTKYSLVIYSHVTDHSLLISFAYCWNILIAHQLTHWGRVTHIWAGKLTNIGSDNGLSPGRRQAIIWTNAGISFIGPLGTNFSEFLIVIHTFSFNEMHLKMPSAKWRLFCLGLNVLTTARLPDLTKPEDVSLC